MVTLPPPSAPALLMFRVPALSVRPPAKVLPLPVSVRLPLPFLTIATVAVLLTIQPLIMVAPVPSLVSVLFCVLSVSRVPFSVSVLAELLIQLWLPLSLNLALPVFMAADPESIRRPTPLTPKTEIMLLLAPKVTALFWVAAK